MEHSKPFLKGRTVAFAITTLVCFIWVILLCVFLSLRWGISNQTERSFVALFLVVEVITMIVLPILILREFRPWLDAARLIFLLVCHLGIAIAFTFRFQKITCLDESLDGPGVCQLFNVYILMASWVAPFLLLVYAACLGVYHWRYIHHPPSEAGSEPDSDDEESLKSKCGEIPFMTPIHDIPPFSYKAQSTRPFSQGRPRSLSVSASQHHQGLSPTRSFPAPLTPYRAQSYHHVVDASRVTGERHDIIFPRRQSTQGLQARATTTTFPLPGSPHDLTNKPTSLIPGNARESLTSSRRPSQVPARVSATWGWGTPFRPSGATNGNLSTNRSPHDSLTSSRRPSEVLTKSSLTGSNENDDETATRTSKKARHESKHLTKTPDHLF